MNHSIIHHLNWRYATKRYDQTRVIPDQTIDLIKEALRLTPTSYGLQPLKFLLIKNQEIRKQLLNYSYNQQSITDASHLIVIASYRDIQSDEIDQYMQNTAVTRDLPLEQLSGYSDFLKRIMNNQTTEQKTTWAQKQAYITLGVLVDICAQLKVDATPIEGFDVKGYDAILNLEEKGLTSTIVVPIGYRHQDDVTQHWKKVRKPAEELFEIY
ncbi:NAD(P)H-dependent oxidoreductase [Crocinitomicaceae bacterium CZZ-1]|uniref:NAD(P)H-dependent oxidoreductase n=1 Tax=Taishania pollutisoli TaxID=2766479 RepID=A0A8J6P7W3_9FLAO|nr:NAD(P)H-dependent oxidoreductase [Taishania pollutisoli]MBC9813699.1 NAD(P)H-dependent oxidoreductase [Taishania pollutisoli]MBX2949471.1 NAD(P)H-dependent oxidoreductase [Crocinitomicaceae bacterium]